MVHRPHAPSRESLALISKTVIALSACLAALAVSLAAPAVSLGAGTDISNATPLSIGTASGQVGFNEVFDDVWAISVPPGQDLRVSCEASDPTADLDLFVYGPDATSIETDAPVAWATTTNDPEILDVGLAAGTYYLDVAAITGASAYTLDVALPPSTALSLVVPTKTPAYGATVSLSGAFVGSTDGAGIGGVPILLWRSADGADWTLLGQSVTSAGPPGVYAFTDPGPVTVRTYYRASFPGSDSYGAATGAVLRVVPHVLLTWSACPSKVTVLRRFTVAGAIRPALPSGLPAIVIKAYRHERGAWVLHASFRAKSSAAGAVTRYTCALTLPGRGSWRLIAWFAGNGRNSATASAPRSLGAR